MSVRAKFRCETITQNVAGAEVYLVPVASGSKENEDFFRYTPSGSLKMATVNQEAAKQFIPGKDYYIDFTLVE